MARAGPAALKQSEGNRKSFFSALRVSGLQQRGRAPPPKCGGALGRFPRSGAPAVIAPQLGSCSVFLGFDEFPLFVVGVGAAPRCSVGLAGGQPHGTMRTGTMGTAPRRPKLGTVALRKGLLGGCGVLCPSPDSTYGCCRVREPLPGAPSPGAPHKVRAGPPWHSGRGHPAVVSGCPGQGPCRGEDPGERWAGCV